MKQLWQKVKLKFKSPLLPRLNKAKKNGDWPLLSFFILSLIILGCLSVSFWGISGPNKIDLHNLNRSPTNEFWFGTDSLGRNMFVMVWYGGRISLLISIFSTLISTIIGVIYGSISAIAPSWLDDLLMRLTDILLSIPAILVIIFMQIFFKQNNIFSLALVISSASWMPLAKIIRTEVKQIWQLDYVAAAKILGGSFWHILQRHLFPNYFPTILFMMVSMLSSAIATESVLTFLGIGLPPNIISWGSMLALSEKALLANYWWIILIPAFFLITTVTCLTNIAEYIRRKKTSVGHNL